MRTIQIESKLQQLSLIEKNIILCDYPIATAKAGLGEQRNSFQTPRGWHIVHQKIGDNAPLGEIFHARLDTKQRYHPDLAKEFPERDWILTRIIRLAGCELGFNLGKNNDSLQRCIYIHGVPDEEIHGIANSHGCIRMRNHDIITLYDQIDVGTPVFIG